MGMARQDRAAAGGAQEGPYSRYIGNCDVTDVTGTLLAAMLVRGHSGLPLQRGHLMGSRKAPSPPSAQKCALVG